MDIRTDLGKASDGNSIEARPQSPAGLARLSIDVEQQHTELDSHWLALVLHCIGSAIACMHLTSKAQGTRAY